MCVFSSSVSVLPAVSRKGVGGGWKTLNLPTTSPVNHNFPSYPPCILFRHVLLFFPVIIISVRLHFFSLTPYSLGCSLLGYIIRRQTTEFHSSLHTHNTIAQIQPTHPIWKKREENYHHRQISYCLRHKKPTNWDERVCVCWKRMMIVCDSWTVNPFEL